MTNPFSILIVEDEALVANDLAARLQQVGYTIAGIADHFEEAVALFRKKIPDLVLLDITLKGKKSGVDIAAAINIILPTPFIFVTAHTDADTLQKAKQTFPAAYLVKPFTTGHLLISIELALHNFAYQKTVNAADLTALQAAEADIYLKQEYLFIKEGQRFVKLQHTDILYLQAEDNYVKIFTAAKSYLIRCTLTKAIEKMNRPEYVRSHRSYCINIHKVESFTEQTIMIGTFAIPIGRNYKEGFVSKFELR